MIKVVILGTGNIAKHLFDAFLGNGTISIEQVVGRSASALEYFKKSTQVSKNYKSVKDADIFIIAVSDDSIQAVSKKLSGKMGLIVHTSGSVSVKVLAPHKNVGVIYPLQTFSMNRPINFKSVPVCLEADQKKDLQLLRKLAESISENVHLLSSTQRKHIHLAAVFANNFTNHLYHLAHKICEENKVSFDILKPLILETADKIVDLTPYSIQTGPARRKDTKTMQSQLEQLTNQWHKKIYEDVSNSILSTYEPDHQN